MRYGLQAILAEREALIASQREAADGFVLVTHVPPAGALAHRAAEGLRVYKDQHGIEQNDGF
jgi:hypothetical protein